jgi:regulator of sigma E protease
VLTLLAALEPALNVIKTVLGIGGLIFVHELGHFLVGRWCGVRAEVFSIGFGPALLKWQPGETEYRLAPIPLGGYVKFLGENPEEDEHAPDSFLAATYPRKAAIMLAGVTMNVITAFALFVWTFSIGVELPAPVVGQVQHGYPAWEHGIQPGDEIVTIDGKEIIEFRDVIQDVVLADAVDVEIRRDGELLPVMRIPTREQPGGIRVLGIGGATTTSPVVRVMPDSDAEQAGFRDRDEVVAFDGEPVETSQEAIALWLESGSGTFTIERNGKPIDITLESSEPQTVHRIGVAFDDLEIGAVQRSGPAAAAGVQAGDLPRAVDGEPVATVRELVERLVDTERPALTATFERGGNPFTVDVGPDPEAFAASLAGSGNALVVRPVFEGEGAGPAERAGITAGSVILAADGTEITTIPELQAVVAAAAEDSRALDVRWRAPDGTEHTAALTPAAVQQPGNPGLIGLTEVTRVVQEKDVVAAVILGVQRTDRWVKRILNTLGSLVTGRVSATNLSGPVAIAKITYKTAETGLGEFLLFLGFISMNLAVLNLLPIPMLDGGQLAMITAERIRGRPLPESVQAGLQWAGLIMLLALMVFVVANDIRNL